MLKHCDPASRYQPLLKEMVVSLSAAACVWSAPLCGMIKLY